LSSDSICGESEPCLAKPISFDKAADCERAMGMVSDPHKKIALKLLREMWTSLANEKLGSSERYYDGTNISIEELHAP